MSDDIRNRASTARIELRETEKAFTDLRAGLVEKLTSSTLDAGKMRETCYFAISTLDSVRRALFQIVQGGALEETLAEMTDPPAKPYTPFVQPIRGAYPR